MRTSQLIYFISVVDTGSFAQAAYENNITQSSISKQIANLEDELGIQLFDRIGRKAVITPAGESFLDFAKKNVKEYNLMRENMLAFANRRETMVKIGMHCLATHYDTWITFTEFQEAYPHLSFEIKQMPNRSIIESLKSHTCNFGILYDQTVDNDKFNMVTLLSDKLVLAVPNEHHLAQSKSIDLKDLKNEPLAFTMEWSQMRQIGTTACKQAGFEPIIQASNTFPEPILSVLKFENLGLLFLEKALHYYSLDGIKIIPLKDDYNVNLVLIYPKYTKLTVAEKYFIDFTKKHPPTLVFNHPKSQLKVKMSNGGCQK